MTELNVVELDPEEDPRIGTLSERIEKVIDDYIEQEYEQDKRVTFANIVGVLSIIKQARIDELLHDLSEID